jgi:hypothetical protein
MLADTTDDQTPLLYNFPPCSATADNGILYVISLFRSQTSPFVLFFIVCLSFSCLYSTNLVAQNTQQFAGNKLLELVGKRQNQAEIKDFLTYCGIQASISTATQTYYPQVGIMIEWTGEMIEKITFCSQDTEYKGLLFNQFPNKLFYNLQFGDNKNTVVRKMGKPSLVHDQTFIYHLIEGDVNIDFRKNILLVSLAYRRCKEGNCDNGYGVYLSRNGDIYKGNWKNGKRHGQGTCTYANGEMYEGLWQHDQFNGRGVFTDKDGKVQKGLWEEGNFIGEIDFKKNLLFELLGKHKSNEQVRLLIENYSKSFEVRQQSFDNQEYLFSNGKLLMHLDEYGFVQRMDVSLAGINDFAPSLNKYFQKETQQKQILFLLGEPDEKKELWKDGGKYALWIYADSVHRQVFYFNPKKQLQSINVSLVNAAKVLQQKVKGTCIKGNCKNGYGEMLTTFGRYKGYFKNEMFNGEGTLFFTNGGTYKGYFKNNAKSGYGEHRWTDGSVYKGNWAGNVRNGRGKMTYANKDRYEGNWKNDKRQGYGIAKYSNGDMYVGQWQQDQHDGKGTLNLKEGQKLVGIWQKGQLVMEAPAAPRKKEK